MRPRDVTETPFTEPLLKMNALPFFPTVTLFATPPETASLPLSSTAMCPAVPPARRESVPPESMVTSSASPPSFTAQTPLLTIVAPSAVPSTTIFPLLTVVAAAVPPPEMCRVPLRSTTVLSTRPSSEM